MLWCQQKFSCTNSYSLFCNLRHALWLHFLLLSIFRRFLLFWSNKEAGAHLGRQKLSWIWGKHVELQSNDFAEMPLIEDSIGSISLTGGNGCRVSGEQLRSVKDEINGLDVALSAAEEQRRELERQLAVTKANKQAPSEVNFGARRALQFPQGKSSIQPMPGHYVWRAWTRLSSCALSCDLTSSSGQCLERGMKQYSMMAILCNCLEVLQYKRSHFIQVCWSINQKLIFHLALEEIPHRRNCLRAHDVLCRWHKMQALIPRIMILSRAHTLLPGKPPSLRQRPILTQSLTDRAAVPCLKTIRQRCLSKEPKVIDRNYRLFGWDSTTEIFFLLLIPLLKISRRFSL